MSAYANAEPVFIKCQQGTPEWFAARCGLITASRFADCVKKQKTKGKEHLLYDKGVKYAAKVALEIISGKRYEEEDEYESWQMRRGIAREPIVRQKFEQATGLVAYESGIVLTHDKRFGYSTDGFISTDGLLEVKSPSSAAKLIELWKTRNIEEYEHQIQGGFWITGRKWAKLVVDCEHLDSCGMGQLVIGVERDEAFIERLEAGLMEFMALVDGHVNALRAAAR